MEFDFSKLLGRIVEKYGTRSAFAAELGMSDQSLSCRLNNKLPLKGEEIYKMSELLCIDAQDIPAYFFTPKVR